MAPYRAAEFNAAERRAHCKQMLGRVRREPRLVHREVGQVTEQLGPNDQRRIRPALNGLSEFRGFIGKIDLGVLQCFRQDPIQPLADDKQAAAGLAGIAYPFTIIEVLLYLFGCLWKAGQPDGLCAQCLMVDLLQQAAAQQHVVFDGCTVPIAVSPSVRGSGVEFAEPWFSHLLEYFDVSMQQRALPFQVERGCPDFRQMAQALGFECLPLKLQCWRW
ncbi:hypothetical protein D9M71_566910 [compost metagenome]